MEKHASNRDAILRVGQAAEMLGVSIETIRRWGDDGTIRVERSTGGQRVVAIAEVSRLLEERRRSKVDLVLPQDKSELCFLLALPDPDRPVGRSAGSSRQEKRGQVRFF